MRHIKDPYVSNQATTVLAIVGDAMCMDGEPSFGQVGWYAGLRPHEQRRIDMENAAAKTTTSDEFNLRRAEYRAKCMVLAGEAFDISWQVNILKAKNQIAPLSLDERAKVETLLIQLDLAELKMKEQALEEVKFLVEHARQQLKAEGK